MTSGKNCKGLGMGRNSRRDVRPETDGREEAGGRAQCGSGVRRPEKSL